jgi:hypothetical protein
VHLAANGLLAASELKLLVANELMAVNALLAANVHLAANVQRNSQSSQSQETALIMRYSLTKLRTCVFLFPFSFPIFLPPNTLPLSALEGSVLLHLFWRLQAFEIPVADISLRIHILDSETHEVHEDGAFGFFFGRWRSIAVWASGHLPWDDVTRT